MKLECILLKIINCLLVQKNRLKFKATYSITVSIDGENFFFLKGTFLEPIKCYGYATVENNECYQISIRRLEKIFR